MRKRQISLPVAMSKFRSVSMSMQCQSPFSRFNGGIVVVSKPKLLHSQGNGASALDLAQVCRNSDVTGPVCSLLSSVDLSLLMGQSFQQPRGDMG